MLAFTTYLEPRNLWIERAFLGLSTMTSDWPPPRGRTASPASVFLQEDLVERVDVAVVFGVRAARFGGLPFLVADVPEDFLGTVPSYLSFYVFTASVDSSRPFQTQGPGLFEVVLGKNPDTIVGGRESSDPASFLHSD